MRYIKVPEPFVTRDPFTRAPSDTVCTFADSVRLALLSIYQRGDGRKVRIAQSKLDDIEEKFNSAAIGSYVELEEDSYKLLQHEFENPNPDIVTSAWAFSSKSHRKAVANATETRPAEMAAQGN